VLGRYGEVRISKKFLREAMTMAQYEVAISYYEQMLKRQVEEDVPDVALSETGQPDAPAAVSTPTPEAWAAMPAGTTPPEASVVASSEHIRALRALALQVDPKGKAEADLVESFKHYPRRLPLIRYQQVHTRLTQRLQEAKGGLALAEA
jgi:hypothetical protein